MKQATLVEKGSHSKSQGPVLPSLPSDLYERLLEDIRLRGIQIPILVDNTTGEVIDGKLRKQIADELGIREIPTIYVGRLTPEERADLRVALNLYRRHLSRSQMRELIAWELKQRPESSDRFIAGRTGVNHRTVASVRSGLETNGEILRYEARTTSNGKQYPVAAKPSVFACSSAEGRRARVLLDRLGDDAPHRPASIRVLHKLLNRKEREELKTGPEAKLPAHIRIECCDFRELAVPSGSLDLVFTDPPWGTSGRRLIRDFAAWGLPNPETGRWAAPGLHWPQRDAASRKRDRQETQLSVDDFLRQRRLSGKEYPTRPGDSLLLETSPHVLQGQVPPHASH